MSEQHPSPLRAVEADLGQRVRPSPDGGNVQGISFDTGRESVAQSKLIQLCSVKSQTIRHLLPTS
jgi:hypothetical protein